MGWTYNIKTLSLNGSINNNETSNLQKSPQQSDGTGRTPNPQANLGKRTNLATCYHTYHSTLTTTPSSSQDILDFLSKTVWGGRMFKWVRNL